MLIWSFSFFSFLILYLYVCGPGLMMMQCVRCGWVFGLWAPHMILCASESIIRYDHALLMVILFKYKFRWPLSPLTLGSICQTQFWTLLILNKSLVNIFLLIESALHLQLGQDECLTSLSSFSLLLLCLIWWSGIWWRLSQLLLISINSINYLYGLFTII